jgi:osmotically-inducible protein OsmY
VALPRRSASAKAQAPGLAAALLTAALTACAHPVTPPRPSGFPVPGTADDARPERSARYAPLEREDLPDRSIEAAIRRGLAESAGLEAATVDVGVAAGQVTLSGSLPSARHRREAEDVARAVLGVRSVHNAIKVEPVVRPDDVVARDVREALSLAWPLPRRPLEVAVAKGVVTLSGTVTSWGARRMAEERAAEVSGVADVVNRLRVGEPTARVSDEALQAAVQSELATLAIARPQSVEVDVRHGTVRLRGQVGTFGLRRSMIERAFVPGVQSVDASDLRVAWRTPAPPAPAAPADARAALRAALASNPTLADLPIAVDIEGATAVLRGVVPTLAAQHEANVVAQESVGIQRVESRLTVAPTALGDRQLAEQVERALIRDAYLDHRTILVRVHDARVQLSGTVDAPFERERAARLAARIAGVREVINDLVVAGR